MRDRKINQKIIIDIILGTISIIILLFYELYYFDFFIDDAYISFHYARNFAVYSLLFFNKKGEPVEAYSNFLWIIISSLFIKINFDPLVSMKIFSIFLSIINLYFIYQISRYFNKEEKRSIIPVFFTSIFPYYGICAITGLETQLYILFLLISVNFCSKVILNNRELKRNNIKILIFLIIGFIGILLTRLEGIFIYILSQTVLIVDFLHVKNQIKSINEYKRKLLLNLLLISIVGGIFIFYMIWRILYFKEIFPLSFQMKASNLGLIPTHFMDDFMKLFPFIYPFIIISFLKLIVELKFFKGKMRLLRIYFFSIICFIFFIALLVGDWMIGFRFYLPGIILIFIYCSEPLFKYSSIKMVMKSPRNYLYKGLNFFEKKIFLSLNLSLNRTLKYILKKKTMKKHIVNLSFFQIKISIFMILSIFLLAPILTDFFGRSNPNTSSLNYYYYRMKKNIQVGKWIGNYYPNSTIAIDDFAGTVAFFSNCDVYEFGYSLTDKNVVSNQSLRDSIILHIDYILGIKPDFFYDIEGFSVWEFELKCRLEFKVNYRKIIDGLYIRNDIKLNQESLSNLPKVECNKVWRSFL